MTPLVNTRQNLPSNNLLILLPVLAILLGASNIIPPFTMNEQNGKVQHVKVRKDHAPATSRTLNDLTPVKHRDSTRHSAASSEDLVPRNGSRQAERRSLEPVAKVVDMPRPAPPSTGKQPRTALRLDERQILDTRVIRLRAEDLLLIIRRAEDVQTRREDGKDAGNASPAQVDGVDGEVAGLSGVEKGHPNDVAKRQHEAQAVGGDVHHGEQAGLHELALEDVVALHGGGEEDAVGKVAVGAVLLCAEGEVEDDPAGQTGAHLQPGFEVDLAEEREGDAGVQFAADVDVVDEAAGVAADGQLT